MPLWENLAISAKRYPDKDALVFFGSTLSYRQLLQQTERLAAYLQSLGVQKGDRVVLNMQNCPQLVIAHFAILRANAVVVPVNPMNRAEELKHYITDPDATVALTTADLAADLAAASNALAAGGQHSLKHLIVTHFTDTFDAQVQGDEAPPPAWRDWLLTRHPLPTLQGAQAHTWQEALACSAAPGPLTTGPQDLAVLPYTSGTTGLPKGCMHTHRSIMHNAISSGLWGNSTAENVALAVVPMFHITGLVSVMHTTIFLGATLVLMPRWDRDVAGYQISKWKVTHWTNIPTMVIDLLGSPQIEKFDLSSLTYIGGGGAAMPEAVAQRLMDQFGLRFVEGYGLTETAAPTHTNPRQAPRRHCLGIPYIGTEALIIDHETLQCLPTGVVGEIVVRGPQVFKGYWNQPEATAQAFTDIAGQTYFRTGDLGRMDEDGYFYMADRLKRMINASGFKVWPAEVEAFLHRHPAVQEACVIASRDAYRGETVKAMIVLRQSHLGQVQPEDIMAWAREHMAAYKYPRAVEFVEALPRNASGKVMWRTLQARQDEQDAVPARH